MCINCGSHATFCDNNLKHISINLDNNNHYTDFQSALNQEVIKDRKCTNCQNNCSKHKEKTTLVLPNSLQCMIVYVHNYINTDKGIIKSKSRLSGLNVPFFTVPSLDNTRFTKSSIIIRQGIETNTGHFKIWTKDLRSKNWLYINDNKVRSYVELFKVLDNVLLVILMRL